MGCFLACFGGAKDRKQRRCPKKSLPANKVNQNYQSLLASPSSQKPVANVDADVLVAELRENKQNQEEGTFNSCRKKVAFDLNVKTYESFKGSSEDEEVKELKEEVKEETKGKVYPASNYRYQNCDDSDDECIDDELEEGFGDSDFEDEDDEIDVMATEEESYCSFFSLAMDKERQQQCCEEVDSPVPVSILDKGSTRDRSQYVHSVLNPVENLSQWKEVKARALPLKGPNKDNITVLTPKTRKSSNKENNDSESETKVISVDASISTWLVSSPKGEEPQRSNSQWSNSSISQEDKPILGALTIEDLKHSSVTSSPRRSPRTKPPLGSVGSHWSRYQNSDVKAFLTLQAG